MPQNKLGIFLSCEEQSARRLVDVAVRAEAAGFGDFWISNHFHPWIDAQGESPFVWSVIGALAAATSATLLDQEGFLTFLADEIAPQFS